MSVYLSIVQTCRVGLVFSVRMGEQSVLETQWYSSHKVVASGLHELRACVLYIYLSCPGRAMASPPGHPPSQYEPAGRWGHCSAFIDGKYYTYGGHFGAGGSPPLSMVEILDLVTEKWQQIPTAGEAPPGHISASCAVIGTYLFHFGGSDRYKYYNTIHCLETSTLTWSAVLPANSQEAPMPKCDSGMLIYANNLVVAGGYGVLPQHPHPDKYVPDPDREGEGWTNEVHCFHVDSSELC